jgi:hypothetical protein
MNYRKARKEFVEWVRTHIIGPGPQNLSDDQITGMRPTEAYQCGILFPIAEQGVDPASTLDEAADSVAEVASTEQDDTDDETTTGKTIRYVPPSSCGFSFYAEGDVIRLNICCWAVHYDAERGHGKPGATIWQRNTCGPKEGIPWDVTLLSSNERTRIPPPLYPVFDFADNNGRVDHRAQLQALCRPHGAGWLITLSFSNIQRTPVFDSSDVREWVEKRESLCLFECELSCRVVAGRVGDYPRAAMSLLAEEDQELAIQYRKKRVLAVGHGAAVDWETGKDGITTLRIDFMPAVEVPSVTADTGDKDDPTLDLDFLAQTDLHPERVTDKLERFVQSYETWIATQEKEQAELSEDEQQAAERIVGRMRQTAQRMQGGVARLRKKSEAHTRRAFSVASRAMALQMRQSRKVAGLKERTPRWRPFQLGFLLMALESAIDNDHIDRDLVDLIWFPTGGGKTEAYLALVAFLVTWRRLTFPDSGGGTTVLMRYTLRLLTGQQFERATRLIFALEHLRRTVPELGLGQEPVTIGIWVGGATTPNSYGEALDLLNHARQNEQIPRKLLLTHCLWCGTPFSPQTSFTATQNGFHFLCSNPGCDFHAGPSNTPLPCNVVDAALYDHPPTLLIGTIDKFARLAWEPRTAAFFGQGGKRPPELIIQDELHLIAGPLGSIAGVYEAALDVVIQAHNSIRPKYIASTATIRNASEQVRALYAREAAVFPPAGLDESDSWFARAIPVSDTQPGRLYVGYLAPARHKAKSIAPLAAALLAGPTALFAEDVDRDALLDAWWTLVSYHTSLKGVGMAYGALDQDAVAHLRFLHDKLRHFADAASSPPLRSRLESRNRLQQLSSMVDAETNHQTFARLQYRFDQEDYIDVVVATNIIAVGVDIGRLAAMIVNGQPLTTAEYIQASSRVGRDAAPGLVYVNFYRDQVRSLSHYESFRAYHESFYRHVEPTSVTPFAYPCRQRALHAALVIVMRHAAGLLDDRAVEKFDPEDETQSALIEALVIRCAEADQQRAAGIRAHLALLQQQWQSFIEENREIMPMKYSEADSAGTGVARLLCDFDAKIVGVWQTLQSMRNVEHTALVRLL